MSIEFTPSPAPAVIAAPISTTPQPAKKKEGGRVAVVVIGAGSTSMRRMLIGRAEESGAMCAVLLTRRGVHADQFETGQQILCTCDPAARPADLTYAGVAPPAFPLASESRPALARA